MSVKNIVVEREEFDFSHEAFKSSRNELEKLAPKLKESKITFQLSGVNPAIANAIRHSVTQESLGYIFKTDVTNVETNEPYIIKHELTDRIRMIRIIQDKSDKKFMSSAKFTIQEKNNSKVPVIVTSASLKNSKSGSVEFDKDVRLAILAPGSYLKITDITIESGYGYSRAEFNNAFPHRYETTEFVDVKVLRSVDKIDTIRVRKSEIEKKIASGKYDSSKTVCVVRDKEFVRASSDETKQEIKKCDFVISSQSITQVSSLVCNPSEFELGFSFSCYDDPKLGVAESLEQLIARLVKLRESVEKFAKSGEQSENMVVELGDPLSSVLVKGESHSISNLLRRAVFDLDPNIAMVNSEIIHPSNRMFKLNLQHPQPLKILVDAIKKNEEMFMKIRKAFV